MNNNTEFIETTDGSVTELLSSSPSVLQEDNDRMTISFNVDRQLIRRTDGEHPVADSRDYLFACFTFSDEWKGAKTALFTDGSHTYEMMLTNDCCQVPWEVITADGFFVSCFCGERITANKAFVRVLPSGFVEGETPSEPTPTVYEQILDALGDKLEASNIKAGQNVTVTTDGNDVTIAASGGGGGDVQIDSTLKKTNGVLGIDFATVTEEGVTPNKAIDKTALDAFGEEVFTLIGVATQGKQDKLTAGSNITIDNNVISATGGSSTPADNSVTTDKIADGAVTEQKLSTEVQQKLNAENNLIIESTNTTYTKTNSTLIVNKINGTVENIEPYVIFNNASINVTQTPINTQHFIVAETENGIVFVNGVGNIFYTPKSTKTFTKLRDVSYGLNSPITITVTENNVIIKGSSTITISKTTIDGFLTNKNINEEVSRMVIGYSGSTAEPTATLYYSLPTTDRTKKLRGKVWNVLGDSITAERAAIPTKYYDYISTRQGGVIVNNYGIGSTCICASGGDNIDTTNAFCNRYNQMAANADIITVLGGINDFGRESASPLGTFGDTVTTTFYGALDTLCKGLINRYPTSTIMFMTPLAVSNFEAWRNRATNPITSDTNSLGLTITDYADAIKKVCRKYAIPVLDLGGEVGFTPYDATQNTTYYADGLHPNISGHLRMSYPIENKLLEIFNS